MTVKAKFKCNGITPGFGEGQKNVRFNAVYGTDGENADFAKATPWGDLTMGIDPSTPAIDAFEVGKEYILTIQEA